MHTARSFVPLAVLGGFLWAAAPVLSFDRGPSSQQHPSPGTGAAPQKQAPKPPPPAANQPNDDRIVKKETRLKQHVVATR
jgi:hypothetical protein